MPTPAGRQYVVTFVDDYSRFVYVYFMRKKSEVLEHFKTFKAEVEKQQVESIRILRTDNGGEYCGNEFARFLRQEGIVHQTGVPYSPQQNGLAKRMNRTLVEKARAMLHYNAVELRWWTEAINCAAYLVNRLPTAAHKETPYERWTGEIPDFSHLKVFDSKGFAQIPKERRSKLDAKTLRCMFMGYSMTSKAYRVVDLRTGRLVVSRSLTLDERMTAHYRDDIAADIPQTRIQHDSVSDDEDDSAVAIEPTVDRDIDMESVVAEQDDHVMEDVGAPEPSTPPVIAHEPSIALPPSTDVGELVFTLVCFPMCRCLHQKTSTKMIYNLLPETVLRHGSSVRVVMKTCSRML
ncbi:hypothetical protein PI124_g22516 [Phytophthora idaei]|nr:hypothetical protein PI124_g22516 [Phytophthora idaei]